MIRKDIRNVDQVRMLIEDIRTCRAEKIRILVQQVTQSNFEVVNLNNITSMEMTNVRRFLSEYMSQMRSLSKTSQEIDEKLTQSTYDVASVSQDMGNAPDSDNEDFSFPNPVGTFKKPNEEKPAETRRILRPKK